MSLPKYSEYKKTNVDWLTEVPAHWNIQSCRGVLTDRNERNDPLINENYLSLMANIGIILYEEKGDVGNKKPEDLGKCKQVYPGDLVINSMNYGIGSYGLSKHRGVCSPVYIVLTPKLNKVEERYVFRILEIKKFQQYAQSFGNGILEHRASISWDILKNIGLPLPSIEEQRNILQFLDIEIAKIDNLVKDQEKMIELLKEKRQTSISNAVTKGINPNVKMKNSGVVWLGDVPEHWEVMTLRRCSSNVQTGGTPSSDSINNEGEDGLDWYTPGDFTDTLTLGRSTKKISTSLIESSGIKIFPSNSVLIISIGGTLGKVGYLNQAASSNQQINAVIPNQKINGYFLAYSLAVKTEQMKYLSNASTIGIMNQEKTKEIWVAVPPLEEQFNITNYLDGITKSLDTLISTCLATITLLYERRSALISAAVTGQIDVRNYQPKEVA